MLNYLLMEYGDVLLLMISCPLTNLETLYVPILIKENYGFLLLKKHILKYTEGMSLLEVILVEICTH